MTDEEIKHYGVLGMKWGVRRSRNSSSSQKKEFKIAKKSQRKLYRDSYDRMKDYQKKSSTVRKRSKELKRLSKKADDLNYELSKYETKDVKSIARKNASKRAKKEISEYSSINERDKSKIIESYIYDSGELEKAINQVNKNNPKYQATKKEYDKTISAYKEKCGKITNDIIGKYGKTKIKGLGTNMNYQELVYYALTDANTMGMFTEAEHKGRN